MSIRPFEPRDTDAVMALAGELRAGLRPWRDADRWLAVSLGWVAESVSAAGSPGNTILVAADDHDVHGFVSVSTRTHVTGDVEAYVGALVVAPSRRREGLGRELLAAAETWARQHGLRTLTLDTGGANQPARALYDATGFVVEDLRLTKLLE